MRLDHVAVGAKHAALSNLGLYGSPRVAVNHVGGLDRLAVHTVLSRLVDVRKLQGGGVSVKAALGTALDDLVSVEDRSLVHASNLGDG